MSKNFWLKFILNEALSVLAAFGALKDPAVEVEVNNAATATQALVIKL